MNSYEYRYELLKSLARSLGYLDCYASSSVFPRGLNVCGARFISSSSTNNDPIVYLSPKPAADNDIGSKLCVKDDDIPYIVETLENGYECNPKPIKDLYAKIASAIARTLNDGGSLVLACGINVFYPSRFEFIDAEDPRVSNFMIEAALNGLLS